MSKTWCDSWQDVREEDLEAVCSQLSKGSLSVVSGGILEEFEQQFACFTKSKYAVAFNNGTAAIHTALWAIGVRAGDDVIVCDYGFHGMVAAVIALGARVVPCDCLPDSLTIDPQDIARCRTERTKAILVLNPGGVPALFDEIRAVCDLPIISDASHAHGAIYKEKPLANWADITCFSLGLKKLISGGELGCAVTDDVELRDKLLIFGHVNRVPADLKQNSWNGNAVGLKFRPHPVAMTLALAQLQRFDEKWDTLTHTCQQLEENFAFSGFIPQAVAPRSKRAYWKIVFKLDEAWFHSLPTKVIEEQLQAQGIPVEPDHYWPLLQNQAIFQWPGNSKFILKRPCTTAQQVVPRTITLHAPVKLPEDVLNGTKTAVRKVAEYAASRLEQEDKHIALH
ncbi:MAG: aminotransferase class I/II-fold pyridoxal phosphate-dependent enzyme [Scytonematopsis contorta HA4267-MV1]|jgi:dTDP-4-amino-4,6-dideoxygalactose transaminase|nr:aminotransferase class I/II-fold pyridoxal phosphate-dependent enzyme [Scytonematopsis contorta HA4267-MV1]